MKHDLLTPCRECPYTARMKGWIGGHGTAMDFHDLAKNDHPMPCHMTVDYDGEGKGHDSQQCAGQAHYMNSMCKVSRLPDLKEMQGRIRLLNIKTPDDLLFSFDGSKLIDFHGK